MFIGLGLVHDPRTRHFQQISDIVDRLFSFHQHVILSVSKLEDRSDGNEDLHSVSEKLWILTESREHLNCSHAVSDVGQLFLASDGLNIFPEGWLIVSSQLLERIVIKIVQLIFFHFTNLDSLMLLIVVIASIVVHP